MNEVVYDCSALRRDCHERCIRGNEGMESGACALLQARVGIIKVYCERDSTETAQDLILTQNEQLLQRIVHDLACTASRFFKCSLRLLFLVATFLCFDGVCSEA